MRENGFTDHNLKNGGFLPPSVCFLIRAAKDARFLSLGSIGCPTKQFFYDWVLYFWLAGMIYLLYPIDNIREESSVRLALGNMTTCQVWNKSFLVFAFPSGFFGFSSNLHANFSIWILSILFSQSRT